MRNERKLIGNRAFYAMVLAVAVPIVVQNGISSFVNLLDNVMVGRVGTEQMSGVAIANQLIMIFDLGVFGGLSGAGIFTAQFYGHGDLAGVRDTLRIKLYVALAVTGAAMAGLLLFGDALIGRFLQGAGDVGDPAATAAYGLRYMRIILIGLIPFALTQTYATTLKETGETVLPMKASVAAVLTNLGLNYVLIYGKLGLPAMGCAGAAVATVISRYVELGIIVISTHRNPGAYAFAKGLYRTLRVPGRLFGSVIVRGLPLLCNELLWSSGMAVLNQCYSLRGLSVIAALNISTTVSNLFAVVMMAMGNAVAIIVGQQLGAGDMEKARDTDRKLIAFAVAVSAVVGLVMAAVAPLIPRIYNTEEAVRVLAASLLAVSGFVLPINAFALTSYFTMRSGGKTLLTFAFDSAYTWVLTIPVAYCLVHFTALTIVPVFWIVQLSNLVKCAIGFVLLRKGVWLNNIVAQ